MKYIFIYVTTPNQETAEKIGYFLVKEKLAACINIIPTVRSIYMWKGAIETDTETALIIKTRNDLYQKVEKAIKKLHPYEVPCIVSLELKSGNSDFLNWISECISP